MAKELHLLPHVSTQGGISGGDLVLVKKTVASVPLDFKVDYNTLFAGLLRESDVGTSPGNLIRLIDSGGNASLPAISAALLTNLNIPQANASTQGAVTLTDAINSTLGVTNGFAATPKSVGDLNILAFKKAGGELSGPLTLPNNTAIKMKLDSGVALDIFNLDTSNDLLIGKTGGAPDQIKAYVDTSFIIHKTDGTALFTFGANGTSSGIKAIDVTAAAKTNLAAGTLDSQVGLLAAGKLNLTGGTMSSHLTLGASASVMGLTDLGASLELVTIDSVDFVKLGSADNTSAGTQIQGPGNGDITLYTGGAVRFTVKQDGSTSGIKAADVTFPSGTGGIIATDVAAALSWLSSNNNFSTSVNFANNVGITSRNAADTADLAVIKLTGSNTLQIGDGNVTAVNLQSTGSVNFVNGAGSTTFGINAQAGTLTGFNASLIGNTSAGGIQATNVQSALNELDVEKFAKIGGTITGSLVVTGNITGTSDERVKDNIQEITGALAKVRAVGGQTFDRTDMDCGRQMGVLAQTAIKHFPEAVYKDKEGNYTVAYGNLAAAGSFAAINELAELVEEQNEQLATLSMSLDSMSDDIAQLKELVQTLQEK